MIKCPNCGKRNADENKFCGECGTKLPEPKNYCPICEKTYTSGEKFCTRCGTKLVVKPETPKPPTGNPDDKPEPPEPDEDFFGRLIRGSGKIPLRIDNPRGGAIIIGEEKFIDYSDKTTDELLTLLNKYIKNKNNAVENQDTLEKEHAVRHIKSIKNELKKRNEEMPPMASKANSNYNGLIEERKR